MVVLDAGELGGEDAEAAGGHGGGEGDEAGFVHAEVMHAVQDDECGGVGVVVGRVEAGADGALGSGDGEVAGGDGLGDDLAEERGDGLVGDEVEHGDGLEMALDEGPDEGCQQDEDEEDDLGGDAAGELGGFAAAAQAGGESSDAGETAAGSGGGRHELRLNDG